MTVTQTDMLAFIDGKIAEAQHCQDTIHDLLAKMNPAWHHRAIERCAHDLKILRAIREAVQR